MIGYKKNKYYHMYIATVDLKSFTILHNIYHKYIWILFDVIIINLLITGK